MHRFVGRAEVLETLAAAMPSGAARQLPGFVLVSGEAGMGKTAVLARYAALAAARSARVAWGACWDGDQVPAFWPWTQALRALTVGAPAVASSGALGVVVPEWAASSSTTADRWQVFDAVAQLLNSSASPTVIVLDDLQWADQSTLDLLRFLAGQAYSGPLLLIGAHRPAAGLGDLTKLAQPVVLAGLTEPEVGELVGSDLATVVYQRSGGNPFFARELGHVLASGAAQAAVPAAVREVITRRVAQVSARCARVLEAAAVAGPQLLPDVLAEVTGEQADDLLHEARAAGLLTAEGFTHDLYRESIYASLSTGQRTDLHHRTGLALAARWERGADVFATELARHFTAAVRLAGPQPALAWARAAAAAESARFAFAEAAGHLARARAAVLEAGIALPDEDLADLLTLEAAAMLRAGDAVTARELLDSAWQRAVSAADPQRLGEVALGLDGIGARFAMPRTALVSTLDTARAALAGAGSALEARVTAALARQLQHSVPADRPRATPLAALAVRIARAQDDPAALAESLLAQHDTLWTPGTGRERQAIAEEIAVLARDCGDPERRAQGLLLAATAQLEQGSPAFRATLTQYEYATAQLRQPRHDYLLRTRRAGLALLDGDIELGERLCESAAELGMAVGDSDAGNVRMSQLLEVARARGDAEFLRRMASDAVTWWVGVPAHAHAIAAGFLARAGDLDAARRELDVFAALPDSRSDRSYLWSVYIGELVTAAIALNDLPLCTQLLAELTPLADACAVSGAMVCFMGAHAHRIGLLHAALGDAVRARQYLGRALETHRALGARAWTADTAAALARLDAVPAILSRDGEMWLASYAGRTVHVRDSKGMQDLFSLLNRPGVPLPAVELAGASVHDRAGADPVLDRTALAAYRRRLSELDDEVHDDDAVHRERAVLEREQLLAELRRAIKPGGGSRTLGIPAAERARKAVTARIRDSIRRIGQVLPELGAHLDRCVRTGNVCRYDPE